MRRFLLLLLLAPLAGCAGFGPARGEITTSVANLSDADAVAHLARTGVTVLAADPAGLRKVHAFALVAVDSFSHTPAVRTDPGHKVVTDHAAMDTLRKIEFQVFAATGVNAGVASQRILGWHALPFDKVVLSKTVESLQSPTYEGRRLGLDRHASPAAFAKACQRLGVDAVGALDAALIADTNGTTGSNDDLKVYDCHGHLLFHGKSRFEHQGHNDMASFAQGFLTLQTGTVNVLLTRLGEVRGAAPAAVASKPAASTPAARRPAAASKPAASKGS